MYECEKNSLLFFDSARTQSCLQLTYNPFNLSQPVTEIFQKIRRLFRFCLQTDCLNLKEYGQFLGSALANKIQSFVLLQALINKFGYLRD